MDAGDVITNGAAGAGIVFIGTWLISLVRAPKLLDDDAQSTIREQAAKITVLESALEARAGTEEAGESEEGLS